MTSDTPQTAPEPEDCPHCGKRPALCIWESIEPIKNRIDVLVLQHPQEQDKELGTARIAAVHFQNAVFRIGLSWPSLSKALGREADPKRWAVLYLGSAKPSDFPPDAEVAALDRKGKPLPDQIAALKGIQGIVVLDGTWSQAKTLWWRNAWMLKCRRVALRPAHPSLYGKLRREPRREALSTLESVGLLVSRLEGRADIEKSLLTTFGRMLDAYRKDQRSRKVESAG